MIKIKISIKELKFHVGLHVLIAIFITLASYVHFPFGSAKGNFIYVAHFLLLHFSLFGFVYIFSLFTKIFKIVFPFIFIIVSSFAFWVYTQDLTIGPGMIQAVLETKIDIVIDTFNLQFLIFILVASVSIFYFLKHHKNTQISSIKSPLLYLGILGICTFFIVENYKFDAFKNRLPYSVYFGTMKYFDTPKFKLKKTTKNLTSKEENLHIVLVVGESVRADHLTLNNYSKNTTPLLSQQKNVVSFSSVYTPFTFTAKSVPQILTDQSILDKPSKNQKFTSVFSVLNSANFQTKWIGNQSLEKSYQDIIYSNSSKIIIDEFHSFLSFKKEKDLTMLSYFDLKNERKNNKITTFHMIGSHWYYNNRIDKKFNHFKPVVTSKYLGASSKEQLINSYDNTIIYLDYFLNELIEKLKKSSQKAILIYISDHGETLGEDGMWLHAQEHDASKNPAMLVWYSDMFEENHPEKINSLTEKKQDSISTDFLFHSVLDISKIEGFPYIKQHSIFY